MCLIQCLILNEDLELNNAWLGVNLRINAKKTFVEIFFEYMLNYVSHFK